MRPALSIIFFTVASGAGLGLLALAALFDAFAPAQLPSQAAWRGALLGLVLVAAGFASSTLHLANPKNAWRSFSRIRTSWLSREAAFALALFPLAGVYIVLAAQTTWDSGRSLFAVITALVSWAVLVSTAMVYASLKPIRQWHTPWTPTSYVLLGHWSGSLLLAATARAYGSVPSSLVTVTVGLGIVALAAKLAYWVTIDRGAATTLAHAIGVDQGVRGPGRSASVRLLDVGHNQATFLTREFVFVLARHRAGVLRAMTIAFGFALPLGSLAWGLARWQRMLVIAVCCMIGLLIERWLFFAEAKHTVRLFHGDSHT